MNISTQDWIEVCLKKYKSQEIPVSEHWENAHHPIPGCLGGTKTVRLWARDHAVHGVLQSEEQNHPCLHYSGRDRDYLEKFYPELLPLLDKWLFKLRSIGGKTTVDLGIGIHGLSSDELATVRKRGVTAQIENKVGIFGRSVEEMREDYKNGLGSLSAEQKSQNAKKAAEKSAKSRWRNTHPDYDPYVSTGAGLTHWQRAKGIDVSFRERVL